MRRGSTTAASRPWVQAQATLGLTAGLAASPPVTDVVAWNQAKACVQRSAQHLRVARQVAVPAFEGARAIEVVALIVLVLKRTIPHHSWRWAGC